MSIMTLRCLHHFATITNQFKTKTITHGFFTDLVKLYNHQNMDPDAGPQQLQNKVQFDIRYYFCRQGGENIPDFQKNTFQVMYDSQAKIAYVKKVVDELAKNHRESDSQMVTGFMSQVLDFDGKPHHLCPVRSFENYIGHLNPKLDRLWQQPLKKKPLDSSIWFKAQAMGHNPLDTFMSKLSDNCALSQHYTNHCIRVTGISNLLHTGKYTPKQVMSITGHKSIHSLAIYQRVQSDKKMMMGMSLLYSLLNAEEVHHLKITMEQQKAQTPALLNNPVLQAIENNIPPLPLPPPVNVPQLHALDPRNKNILPVKNALVPFNPTANQATAPKPASVSTPPETNAAQNDINILDLLCSDMDNDNENQALSIAAQQIEAQLSANNTTSMSKTAVMKQVKPPVTTFTGCSFGNIGTLNIHIHKH